METKEKYLEQAEIEVKTLLSDLYEEESYTLKEISRIRDTLQHKVSALENEFNDVSKKRKELQEKFNRLKEAGDEGWTKVKEDFELALKYAEGDRESFIQKAEKLLNDIGTKIGELEEKAVNATEEVRNNMNDKIKNLNISRDELQAKVNKIKEDSTDKWKEIKHWFAEKSKSVKDYITSIGKD